MSGTQELPWLDYAKGLLGPVIAKSEEGGDEWWNEWERVWDLLDEWMSEGGRNELVEWLWDEHPAFMERARTRDAIHLDHLYQAAARSHRHFDLMGAGVKFHDTPLDVQAHYSVLYGEDAAAEWERRARILRGDADDLEA